MINEFTKYGFVVTKYKGDDNTFYTKTTTVSNTPFDEYVSDGYVDSNDIAIVEIFKLNETWYIQGVVPNSSLDHFKVELESEEGQSIYNKLKNS